MIRMRKSDVKYVVVHCTDTKPNQPCNVEIINDWHQQRGFEMIGYHYVVLPDGTVEHGRPCFYRGAHCKAAAMNSKSIGVCYVGGRNAGGITADTRTEKQKAMLSALIGMLKRRFPGVRVIGHRDADRSKACPCFDASKEYASV